MLIFDKFLKIICKFYMSGFNYLLFFAPVVYLQPRFGDLTLPKLIRCPLLENCVIPFSVTQTNKYVIIHLLTLTLKGMVKLIA